MYLDILIFALVAAFLIYRLNAALGTRQGDERPRQNPFAAPEKKPQALQAPIPFKSPQKKLQQTASLEQLIDAAANKDHRIERGLEEITAADTSFEPIRFMAGAKYAFETIVNAYNNGDRATLRPLLSPKLYADFDAGIKAREEEGRVAETQIRHIKDTRIVEAHLGGTMAYITVDYNVEQTTVMRDKEGNLVEGDSGRISSVEDIWTFTRDTRASDPNWMLIQTSTAEQ